MWRQVSKKRIPKFYESHSDTEEPTGYSTKTEQNASRNWMFLSSALTSSSAVQRPADEKPEENDSQQSPPVIVERAVHAAGHRRPYECAETEAGSADCEVENSCGHLPSRAHFP